MQNVTPFEVCKCLDLKGSVVELCSNPATGLKKFEYKSQDRGAMITRYYPACEVHRDRDPLLDG